MGEDKLRYQKEQFFRTFLEEVNVKVNKVLLINNQCVYFYETIPTSNRILP